MCFDLPISCKMTNGMFILHFVYWFGFAQKLILIISALMTYPAEVLLEG